MMDKVRTFIRQQGMIASGDRLVAGVSGGADSVALFLILLELRKEYALSFSVVHVNHGLREEAPGDEEYVKQLCEQHGIVCHVFHENVSELAKRERCSLEEAGRNCRYRHFYEVMKEEGADKLAVAHHMDDQAETILFRLVRGTDLSGMRGMLPVTEVTDNDEQQGAVKKIIRPLLSCRKKELVTWLSDRKILWKEDATNKENDYARNSVRNLVLPVLAEMNEQAVAHIAGFGMRAAAYEDYFKQTAYRYIKENGEYRETQVSFDRKRLLEQADIIAEKILYESLVLVCGAAKDLTEEHVKGVYGLLGKQSGRKVDLPYGVEALTQYDRVIIRKKRKEQNAAWCYTVRLDTLRTAEEVVVSLPQGGQIFISLEKTPTSISGNGEVFVNISQNHYTKIFDCATIGNMLYVRPPEQEDYLVIDTNGHRKKIGKYLKDSKIPAGERRNQVVVVAGHQVLWVVGGRRSEDYRIENNTRDILVVRYEGVQNGISH